MKSAACYCPSSRKKYFSVHWPSGVYQIEAETQVWKKVADNVIDAEIETETESDESYYYY